MKTALKGDARALRERGLSLSQISDRLDVSKGTVSLWTKGIALRPFGIERLQNKCLQDQRKGHDILRQKKITRLKDAETAAQDLVRKVDNDPSVSACILASIYQCEGLKTDGDIRFSNSDPDIIRLFLATFRQTFATDESKFRVRIHAHDYHNESELIKYWSDTTNIKVSQFYKSFVKPSNHTYAKEAYKGCIHITYYDSHVARTLCSFAKMLNKLYI